MKSIVAYDVASSGKTTQTKIQIPRSVRFEKLAEILVVLSPGSEVAQVSLHSADCVFQLARP